jgi:predicted TIM-barrel fold metal-dependent hydrolase
MKRRRRTTILLGLALALALVAAWLFVPAVKPRKPDPHLPVDLPVGTLRTGQPWASMEIIDVHGHIGTFRGYDLSLETLLDNVNRWGVRQVLISNIDGADLPGTTRNLDETEANRATADAVTRHPQQLRGLLWTRPSDGSAANLEAFLKPDDLIGGGAPRIFVGLKFHPDMNRFDADDPAVDPYLALCETYKLPAVFHSGAKGSPSDPEKIYAAARRHPAVPIVLYHMGFNADHAHAILVAKQANEKGDAQLYLETAQVDIDAVLNAIAQLGSDRVLFGTDAAYYGADHYARYEGLINTLKEKLSDADFANVTRENAKRLFHLK